jgi:predicted Zn-dependent protease
MKRIRMAAALLLFTGFCHAQAPASARYLNPAAYPEQDSSAVWRSLGASYVRNALKDNTLDRDPAWNARIDAVMASVGAAAAKLYPDYAGSSWTALLIDGFGHGAVAFPGGTVLVDAGFVRRLALNDHEVALLLAHEVAHLVAGHPSEKLSFMAETLGKERAPTAGSALLAFYTQDSYAFLFQPTARLQEREADAIGARILLASGYDALQALALFDKLAKIEPDGSDTSSHDLAAVRKQAVLRVLEGLRGPAPRAAH